MIWNFVARMKTSIYVDRELWTRFREHAIKSSVKASRLLEDLMEDEVFELTLAKALAEQAGREDYEINFEPIEPKEATVSELIRTMRDERASLPR
jgi:hypothetical protein